MPSEFVKLAINVTDFTADECGEILELFERLGYPCSTWGFHKHNHVTFLYTHINELTKEKSLEGYYTMSPPFTYSLIRLNELKAMATLHNVANLMFDATSNEHHTPIDNENYMHFVDASKRLNITWTLDLECLPHIILRTQPKNPKQMVVNVPELKHLASKSIEFHNGMLVTLRNNNQYYYVDNNLLPINNEDIITNVDNNYHNHYHNSNPNLDIINIQEMNQI